MRLDKFLTEQGLGSRSQVKQLLKKGGITVNDIPCKTPDMKINEKQDIVKYHGQPLAYQQFHYYMLNKPSGVVSATNDNVSDTVLSLLKGVPTKGLFPVGRLDKDTEGLLLITDDGQLSHNLLSPAKHVDKTYFARIDGMVTDEDIQHFQQGIDIGDEKLTKPARLQILHTSDETPISEVLLTITEGRFHQVKRMFQALDKRVLYLKRISMGNLQLDEELLPGEFRELTDIEIQLLKK